MFLHPNRIIPCLVQTNLRGEVKETPINNLSSLVQGIVPKSLTEAKKVLLL